MKKENAIEVKNMTKQFDVYSDKASTLKEKLLFWKRGNKEIRTGAVLQPLSNTGHYDI